MRCKRNKRQSTYGINTCGARFSRLRRHGPRYPCNRDSSAPRHFTGFKLLRVLRTSHVQPASTSMHSCYLHLHHACPIQMLNPTLALALSSTRRVRLAQSTLSRLEGLGRGSGTGDDMQPSGAFPAPSPSTGQHRPAQVSSARLTLPPAAHCQRHHNNGGLINKTRDRKSRHMQPNPNPRPMAPGRMQVQATRATGPCFTCAPSRRVWHHGCRRLAPILAG